MTTRRYTNIGISLVLVLLAMSGACSNLYYYNFGGEGVNIGTYIVFAISLLGFLIGLVNLRAIAAARMGRLLLALLALGVLLALYFTFCFGKDRAVALKATLSFFFIPLISIGAYALAGRDGTPFARLLLFLGALFSGIGILQFLVGINTTVGWQVLHGEEYLSFWDIGWIRPTAWVGNSILYSALVYMLFIFAYQYYLLKGGALAFLSSLLLVGAIYVAMSRYTLLITVVSWFALSLMWCVFQANTLRVLMRACAVTLISIVLMMSLSYYNSFGIGMWRLKSSQPVVDAETNPIANSQQALPALEQPNAVDEKEPPSNDLSRNANKQVNEVIDSDSATSTQRDTFSAQPATSNAEPDVAAAQQTPEATAGIVPVIFDRFRTSSQYSQGSNKMHAWETQQAIQRILDGQGPAGWGSEGISAKSSIISDGLWFQFAIEVGMLNAGLFICWLLLIFVFAAMGIVGAYRRHRAAGRVSIDIKQSAFLYVSGISVLAYAAYALLGGVINSSYACRITYALFWVLIGCFMKAADASHGQETKRLGDDRI